MYVRKKILSNNRPCIATIPITIKGFKRDENGNDVPGILRLQPDAETSTKGCGKHGINTQTEPITIIGRSNKGLIGAMINYIKGTTEESLHKTKIGVVGKHTVGRLKRWTQRISELYKMSEHAI